MDRVASLLRRKHGSHIRSIAVLPLQNLSGDPAQDFFADGMTEELITELSRIHSLRVISHTSVMEYKGTSKHLPQIARNWEWMASSRVPSFAKTTRFA